MAGGLARQLSYALQRWALRRKTLVARGLPYGMALRFCTPDDVGRRIFKRGVHEPHILELLRSQSPPPGGAIALDVGANLGWYSVVLDRLHGGTVEIFAFEPDPLNFGLLQENLALNRASSVRPFALALSDRRGESGLHRYRDINLGRHSLEDLPDSGAATPVPTERLDAFLTDQQRQDRPVELLKVDVEGHEPAVIRGAEATLRRTRLLVLEYSPMYYRDGDAADMLNRIETAGLRPMRFGAGGWRPSGRAELLALRVQEDTAWMRA